MTMTMTMDERYTFYTEVLKIDPHREMVEASIFIDFLKLRSKGRSLIELVQSDMEAHEDYCDMCLFRRVGSSGGPTNRQ